MICAFRCRLTAILFVGATLLVTGGCSNNRSDIIADPTPALVSHGRTAQQNENTHVRVIDNNERSIWDDLSRIMLLDKTSRLNPITVP